MPTRIVCHWLQLNYIMGKSRGYSVRHENRQFSRQLYSILFGRHIPLSFILFQLIYNMSQPIIRFYVISSKMLIRSGKKRNSVQLTPQTIVRSRKHFKTVILGDPKQQAERNHRKQLQKFGKELIAIVMDEMFFQIRQQEKWAEDKDVIVEQMCGMLGEEEGGRALGEGIEGIKQPMKEDVEPQCANVKVAWRRLPIDPVGEIRKVAISNPTKQSFYGRQKIQNFDPLIPLDLKFPKNPMQDPQDQRLSQLRKQYLQKLKDEQQKNLTMFKRAAKASDSQLARNPGEYTFDYNGKIICEKKREQTNTAYEQGQGQYAVKEGQGNEEFHIDTGRVEAVKGRRNRSLIESDEQRYSKEERYKNYIREERRDWRRVEKAGPNKLEKGVFLYTYGKMKEDTGKDTKQDTTTINNRSQQSKSLPMRNSQPRNSLQNQTVPYQINKPQAPESLSQKQKVSSQFNHILSAHSKNQDHSHSVYETRSLHVKCSSDNRIYVNDQITTKENIRNLFKVTLNKLTCPKISAVNGEIKGNLNQKSEKYEKRKVLEDLSPTIKLPRITS